MAEREHLDLPCELNNTERQLINLMLENPYQVVTYLTLTKTFPFSTYSHEGIGSMVHRINNKIESVSPETKILHGNSSLSKGIGIVTRSGYSGENKKDDKQELLQRLDLCIQEEVKKLALQDKKLQWFDINGYSIAFPEFDTKDHPSIHCTIIQDCSNESVHALFLTRGDFNMLRKFAESGGYIDQTMATKVARIKLEESVMVIQKKATRALGKEVHFFKQIRPGYTADGSLAGRNNYVAGFIRGLIEKNPSKYKSLASNGNKIILVYHENYVEILLGATESILNHLGASNQDIPFILTKTRPYLIISSEVLYPYKENHIFIEATPGDAKLTMLFANSGSLVFNLASIPLRQQQIVIKRLFNLVDRIERNGYDITPDTGIKKDILIIFPIPKFNHNSSKLPGLKQQP